MMLVDHSVVLKEHLWELLMVGHLVAQRAVSSVKHWAEWTVAQKAASMESCLVANSADHWVVQMVA